KIREPVLRQAEFNTQASDTIARQITPGPSTRGTHVPMVAELIFLGIPSSPRRKNTAQRFDEGRQRGVRPIPFESNMQRIEANLHVQYIRPLPSFRPKASELKGATFLQTSEPLSNINGVAVFDRPADDRLDEVDNAHGGASGRRGSRGV